MSILHASTTLLVPATWPILWLIFYIDNNSGYFLLTAFTIVYIFNDPYFSFFMSFLFVTRVAAIHFHTVCYRLPFWESPIILEIWCNKNALHKTIRSVIRQGAPEMKVWMYRKTSNISRTLVCNTIGDHSDVVGATPVGAASTTSAYLS